MRQIYQRGDKAQKYQGDISLLELSREAAKNLIFQPLPKQGYVVAVGETTGNKHVIVAEKNSMVEYAGTDNGVFIKVSEGFASLTGHQEHEPFIKTMKPLKEKIFFVGRMYEFDEIERMRTVAD